MKYVLGFVAIFIAALICVFGIIKYEESRETTTTNNSENLGSADGVKKDKETTIIIEKLASIADVDALKTELNLSDDVVNVLKKYAPRISYAVDDNNIYVRRGGYGTNKSGLIGVYTVDNGKLNAVNKNLSDFNNKLTDDNLKWTDINVKNTEHDKGVAEEIIKKYFFVTANNQKLDAVGIFAYIADRSKHIQGSGMITNIVPLSLAEITDIYNTAYSSTYNASQVYEDMKKAEHMKYREIDDSYTGNESKYINSLGNGEILYFTKDKMYLSGFGGVGGASMNYPAPQSEWTIDGDKIVIPIIGPTGKEESKYTLRLNNKKYEGGEARSKYYIESTR